MKSKLVIAALILASIPSAAAAADRSGGGFYNSVTSSLISFGRGVLWGPRWKDPKG
jgi:hypothetical protein